MIKTDIAVIGGGLAGMAAAYVAAATGAETVHFAPKGPADRRTSALMQPTIDFLQQSGLVEDPAEIAEPLTKIRIIDATRRLLRAPETLFDSREANLEAFGWNFPNATLLEHMAKKVASLSNLTTLAMPLEKIEQQDEGFLLTTTDGTSVLARHVVGADGKKSRIRDFAKITTREHKFSQSALVCDLDMERPLNGESVEFHYENGPFTLVPAGENRANLVWIDTEAALSDALQTSADDFAALLTTKSMRLFGNITPTTKAIVFPLSSLTVSAAGSRGVTLVGEAAHAFPPIGAQGLNLGLRDVADLAQALKSVDRSSASWSEEISEIYARSRAADLAKTGTMVDALFKSLITDFLPTQGVRAVGLWSLKLLPSLRRKAFGFGMGVTGHNDR